MTQNSYDRKAILDIMADSDLNRPSLLIAMMSNSDVLEKMESCFSFEEITDLHFEFAKRCIIQNPDGVTAPNRYIAAHELVNWLIELKRSHEEKIVNDFVYWLECFYKEFILDEDVKICIITGILEHLFEDVDIRLKFLYWRDDPMLVEAYKMAEEWIH
ncbi:hypothetical protein LLG95_13505 [bacterium]|nr:hypothetical protein [bacterium]